MIGDPTTESVTLQDAGAVFVFDRSAAAPVEVAPLSDFLTHLELNAPARAAFDQDADDDGVSNLLEFFAGTDSLSSQESSSPELKMFEQGPFSHVHQYRERLGPVGLTPKFYCSRTLAADSWYPIVRPRFTEDIVGDGFRLRTLDLTNEVVEGQPLFIKMHLDVID